MEHQEPDLSLLPPAPPWPLNHPLPDDNEGGELTTPRDLLDCHGNTVKANTGEVSMEFS